jgi:ABC-2 type transport system permease protein
MLGGFWKLTWLETKIFVREPMGVLGTVGIPIILFLLLGRALRPRAGSSGPPSQFLGEGLPVFASIFIAISAAVSLIAIISIYREGGILKRLRATPLRPHTILGAHVVVKLLFTGLTLALLVLAGRRFYPVTLDIHFVSFALALLVTTLSILSIGFVIASIVPTARFAQPIGSAILYPMLAISGIFVPLEALPRGWHALGSALPVTHAVSLLRGAWAGASWFDYMPSLGVLALNLVICTALSAKIFRWE